MTKAQFTRFTLSKRQARRQKGSTRFTKQAEAKGQERNKKVFLLEIKSLINKFTIYQYMIFFLVVLNLVSTFFYGFGIKALLPVVIAVATTTILDSAISYFKSKTLEFPKSALISGLFIGGLLTQDLQWYVYVLAGAIAILSKHLIKIQQKHLFNPANFGVLLVSVIFGAAHTWWISSPLVLVLIFGIFGWRRRKLSHQDEAADKVCFNHFVTEKSFKLSPPHGDYWRALYRNLVPIFGDPEKIQAFFQENREWMRKERLYNDDLRHQYKNSSLIKKFLEFLLNGKLGNIVICH